MNTQLKDQDSYKSRIGKYKRREHLTAWFGGGYLALVALMTTKVFEQANPPALLTAILVTSILCGGGSLGFARVGFEWAATLLGRKIEDKKVMETDSLSPEDKKWPSGPERFWRIAIASLAVAGFVTLFCVWWPVLGQVLEGHQPLSSPVPTTVSTPLKTPTTAPSSYIPPIPAGTIGPLLPPPIGGKGIP